jgi:hypothetical protein
MSVVVADDGTDYRKYDEYLDRYLPELLLRADEIYQDMTTAEALINSSIEYDLSWEVRKKENIAFASALIKEEERGAQPARFERDGVTYSYNAEASNPDQLWTSESRTDLEATPPMIGIMYLDNEGNVIVYRNGKWITVDGSKDVDYQTYITEANMNNGAIQFDTTSGGIKRVLTDHDFTFIPGIALDGKVEDLEKFPFEKGGNIGFYPVIEFFLPDESMAYGYILNIASIGKSSIHFPDSPDIVLHYSSSSGKMDKWFEEAYQIGKTFYIGISPSHNQYHELEVGAKEVISNNLISDKILDGDIDPSELSSSYIIGQSHTIYNPSITIKDGKPVPYP